MGEGNRELRRRKREASQPAARSIKGGRARAEPRHYLTRYCFRVGLGQLLLSPPEVDLLGSVTVEDINSQLL